MSSAQGDVVGGLLSKQPDWLHGSNADPSTGKLPTLAPAQGGAAAAGKAASSLPPLVGRGMGAAAGGGSSLPPLAAGGAKALVPAGSQHKPQEAEADAEGSDMHGAGGPAHAEGGHAGKQVSTRTVSRTIMLAHRAGWRDRLSVTSTADSCQADCCQQAVTAKTGTMR